MKKVALGLVIAFGLIAATTSCTVGKSHHCQAQKTSNHR